MERYQTSLKQFEVNLLSSYCFAHLTGVSCSVEHEGITHSVPLAFTKRSWGKWFDCHDFIVTVLKNGEVWVRIKIPDQHDDIGFLVRQFSLSEGNKGDVVHLFENAEDGQFLLSVWYRIVNIYLFDEILGCGNPDPSFHQKRMTRSVATIKRLKKNGVGGTKKKKAKTA